MKNINMDLESSGEKHSRAILDLTFAQALTASIRIYNGGEEPVFNPISIQSINLFMQIANLVPLTPNEYKQSLLESVQRGEVIIQNLITHRRETIPLFSSNNINLLEMFYYDDQITRIRNSTLVQETIQEIILADDLAAYN